MSPNTNNRHKSEGVGNVMFAYACTSQAWSRAMQDGHCITSLHMPSGPRKVEFC